MAFFDWNHDGKKNYVDNAIEMMIIDDIEAEEAKNKKDMSYENYTPEWGDGYSGKKAYSRNNKASGKEADEEFDRALGTVVKIFLTVIASIIFIMNFFAIFFGYVSWAGLILSSVVLLLIIRNTVRKRRK